MGVDRWGTGGCIPHFSVENLMCFYLLLTYICLSAYVIDTGVTSLPFSMSGIRISTSFSQPILPSAPYQQVNVDDRIGIRGVDGDRKRPNFKLIFKSFLPKCVSSGTPPRAPLGGLQRPQTSSCKKVGSHTNPSPPHFLIRIDALAVSHLSHHRNTYMS